jgi:hypothetical protein
VLNGQHQLIALVLAVQEWEKHPGKWKDYWQEEPTIDKLIVMGVSEDDDTVNTMDTARPRSLADVLYRSEFFRTKPKRERMEAARALSYAVKVLWHRTRADLNAFAPRRTHAESLDLIARHPRLIECVAFTVAEKESLTPLYSVGCAAGLLYLMAVSDTDPKQYEDSENPNESALDFSRWDQAQDFFVELSNNAERMAPVRNAIARLVQDGRASFETRTAILVKAWNLYVADKPITDKLIALRYTTDDDGIAHLTDHPRVGGIDLGSSADD